MFLHAKQAGISSTGTLAPEAVPPEPDGRRRRDRAQGHLAPLSEYNISQIRALARACMALSRAQGRRQIILHTTMAMQVACAKHEKPGFRRTQDLDFLQQDLQVFRYRFDLGAASA